MMKKREVIWYSAGTIIYALATMIILGIVKRVSGQNAGDDFSIAFTLAQTLLTIGYFEIRPFQVTDASGKYSFGDYFTLRSLTTIAMLVSCFAYLLFTKRELGAWPLMIVLCIYKMADSMADIYEGDYQKENHLGLAGVSMVIRVIFSLLIFFVCMIGTKDCLISALMMTVASFLVVIFINPFMRNKFCRPEGFNLRGNWRGIFKETLLIAVSSFLYAYMISSSKFAVDYYDDSYNYIFYVLFLPSWAINLLSTMIFKPVLTQMTDHYAKKDFRKYLKRTLILLMAVAGLTLICLIGAWLLGIPVLSFIFDVDLSKYRAELLILLVGGGFNAAGILMYYAILVMRLSKGIFVSYCISFAVSVFLPIYAMKAYGIRGASVAYAIVMLVLLMCFIALFLWRIRKDLKNEG